MQSEMQNTGREYGLDFLKILATIFIIFHHYQQVFLIRFDRGINFFFGTFNFGYMVELFFVLSGYFSVKYIYKIQRGLSFKEFFLYKFFRFFPMVFYSAIVYEAMVLLYRHTGSGDPERFGHLSVWGTISTALMMQEGGVLENPMINNPTWYLSVLMICYVLFYFLIWISRHLRIPYVYLFTGVILVGFAINTYELSLPFLNAYVSRGYVCFFFGIIFHMIYDRYIKTENSKTRPVFILASVLTITVLTVSIVYKYSIVSDGISYLLCFLYYPSLMILVQCDPLKSLFGHKFVGTGANGAFNAYIWHSDLIVLLYCINIFYDGKIKLDSRITMFTVTFIILLFGMASYYFIELPSRKILKKCGGLLNGGKS